MRQRTPPHVGLSGSVPTALLCSARHRREPWLPWLPSPFAFKLALHSHALGATFSTDAATSVGSICRCRFGWIAPLQGAVSLLVSCDFHGRRCTSADSCEQGNLRTRTKSASA